MNETDTTRKGRSLLRLFTLAALALVAIGLLAASVNQAAAGDLQRPGKSPQFSNIWLCNDTSGALASNCNHTDIGFFINPTITTADPKCVGFPNFRPDAECDRQDVGGWEFEIRYDQKYINVDLEAAYPLILGTDFCATTQGQGFVQIRCNTKGKDLPLNGISQLAVAHITPTSDDFSLLKANQENGIVTQLINQDCNLFDTQGHPISLEGGHDWCANDGAVTIRYLEGDVHSDCVIDIHDQQQIAFRWGSHEGQLLYNSIFDLEPSAPKLGDGDIDGKDIQTVFGRHDSSCKLPHPAQPPIDPKAKVEPPLPPFAINLGEFVGTVENCGVQGIDTVTAAWDATIGNPAPSILLQKLGETSNCAAAFADIKTPLEGGLVSAVTELNFDVKQDGHCGNGSPRFNLELNGASNAFLGCNFGGTQTDLGNGWTHVEFSSAQIAAAVATASGLPTDTLTDLYIIADEGDDTGPDNTGTSYIDNISVNGDIIGSP